jgi:hypothetical protein
MTLVDEVSAQLKAFVGGRLSAHELAGWLDSVAPELHALGEEGPRRAVGHVYVVLAELSHGDRTVESARDEVTKLLNSDNVPEVNGAGPSASITTRSTPR